MIPYVITDDQSMVRYTGKRRGVPIAEILSGVRKKDGLHVELVEGGVYEITAISNGKEDRNYAHVISVEQIKSITRAEALALLPEVDR